MRRWSIAALLLFCASVHATGLPTPEDDLRRAQAQIDETRARQPALDLLARQQPGFEAAWREQLRQRLVVAPRREARAASEAIAVGLALNAINGHLARAGDPAVEGLFVQQRRLMAAAKDDGALCAILLNTPAAREDRAGAMPWLLQKPWRDGRADLLAAISTLVIDAENKPVRRLPPEQERWFTQRIAGRISGRFGADGLARYERLQNGNGAPLERCRGLHELFEVLAEQPPALRAMLLRAYFGQ